MKITSRKKDLQEKKDEYRPIKYFQEIDDIFFDRQKKNVPLLFKLSRRTVLFFFLIQIVLLILYAIGNYQNFLDENMNLVMESVLFSSFLLNFFTLFTLVQGIILLIRKKTRKASNYVLQIVLLSLLLIYSLLIMLSFCFIEIISVGRI